MSVLYSVYVLSNVILLRKSTTITENWIWYKMFILSLLCMLTFVYILFLLKNNEMINLQNLLSFISKNNVPFAIIVFHSLEARAVKQIEKQYLYVKHYKPTINEIEFNPRSRSAMLRIGYNNE